MKKIESKTLNFIVSRQNLGNGNYIEIVRTISLNKAKMFIHLMNKGIYRKYRIYDIKKGMYVKVIEFKE